MKQTDESIMTMTSIKNNNVVASMARMLLVALMMAFAPSAWASDEPRGELEEGENTIYGIQNGSGDMYLFVAPGTAVYEFATHGNLDTYGFIFDYKTGILLTENDDGAEGNNFQMRLSMDEGDSILVIVKEYGEDVVIDEFTLTVTEFVWEVDVIADLVPGSNLIKLPMEDRTDGNLGDITTYCVYALTPQKDAYITVEAYGEDFFYLQFFDGAGSKLYMEEGQLRVKEGKVYYFAFLPECPEEGEDSIEVHVCIKGLFDQTVPTPTLTIVNNKIVASCPVKDAEYSFVWYVVTAEGYDLPSGRTIPWPVVEVSCIATADGYNDSRAATLRYTVAAGNGSDVDGSGTVDANDIMQVMDNILLQSEAGIPMPE